MKSKIDNLNAELNDYPLDWQTDGRVNCSPPNSGRRLIVTPDVALKSLMELQARQAILAKSEGGN